MKVNVLIFIVVFFATVTSTYVRGSETEKSQKNVQGRAPASVFGLKNVGVDLPRDPAWVEDKRGPASVIQGEGEPAVIRLEVSQDRNPQIAPRKEF